MLTAIVLLAQTATATPAPPPATPPPKMKFTGGFGRAPSPVGQKVVIDENSVPRRTPPHTKDYVPQTSPDCETGAFKGQLDSAVTRFKADLDVARSTPRMSLAAQISRLQDAQRAFQQLPAPACASAVTAAASAWMDSAISSLTHFLGKNEGGSIIEDIITADKWRKYQAERYYLP